MEIKITYPKEVERDRLVNNLKSWIGENFWDKELVRYEIKWNYLNAQDVKNGVL